MEGWWRALLIRDPREACSISTEPLSVKNQVVGVLREEGEPGALCSLRRIWTCGSLAKLATLRA